MERNALTVRSTGAGSSEERSDVADDHDKHNSPFCEASLKKSGTLFASRRAVLLGLAAGLASLLAVTGTAAPAWSATGGDDAGERLPEAITAGSDHTVKRWDASGRLVGTIGSYTESVHAIAAHHGELFSVAADGKLRGIDLASGKTFLNVKAHSEGAVALTVSADGETAVTGGTDSVLRLWDIKNRRFLTDFPKAHGGAITAVQLTSDRARLVSGSADRTLRIWKLDADPKRPTIEYRATIIAHDDPVTAIAVTSDDRLIGSVSADGTLKVWNLASGTLVQRMRLGSAGRSLAFSPDGKTVATGSEDGKIRMWNPENGMPLPFMGSHELSVTALAWTQDGKILVSGSEDKTLRFWNVATGHQIARITAHDGAVQSIVLL